MLELIGQFWDITLLFCSIKGFLFFTAVAVVIAAAQLFYANTREEEED
jgi:hypothetical protein